VTLAAAQLAELATDAVARTVEVRPLGARRTGVRRTMITEEDRPKPPELVNLYAAIPEVFRTLKEEFQVPDTYELVLHDVDAAEPFLRNTLDIAALTMRKIQALRWVTKPGVETANDVVVTLAADLLRALDYLVACCGDDTKADALTRFKNRVVLAARRAGGDGGVARLHRTHDRTGLSFAVAGHCRLRVISRFSQPTHGVAGGAGVRGTRPPARSPLQLAGPR
jgi:hypothetical protein